MTAFDDLQLLRTFVRIAESGSISSHSLRLKPVLNAEGVSFAWPCSRASGSLLDHCGSLVTTSRRAHLECFP